MRPGWARRTTTVPFPAARHIPCARIVGRVVAGKRLFGRWGRIVVVAVTTDLDPAIAARLKRTPDGLVAAIVREHGTGDVLMLAWMDDEALHRTLTTGRATYWSRSRQEYWVKGATSGHHQFVKSVALDCDGDALLVTVEQTGAACHTGEHTCFFDELPVSSS
ncbi:phosphoribosyl-AMP cyclohydrolase [Paractinoplanes atraurantiacus]|uniref:Phosphoribosyl-AMP cyclohydrolase n=1 Tax=Paractinoplanes atraurantiacus TaxID=1036182 RepID=A0A285ISG8_9ACTN|nr:phosphoribosyl-AMP cyclohydrolase [Actinoplanes atraurantiacus]